MIFLTVRCRDRKSFVQHKQLEASVWVTEAISRQVVFESPGQEVKSEVFCSYSTCIGEIVVLIVLGSLQCLSQSRKNRRNCLQKHDKVINSFSWFHKYLLTSIYSSKGVIEYFWPMHSSATPGPSLTRTPCLRLKSYACEKCLSSRGLVNKKSTGLYCTHGFRDSYLGQSS